MKEKIELAFQSVQFALIEVRVLKIGVLAAEHKLEKAQNVLESLMPPLPAAE